MPLSEHHDVIKAVPADRANEPLSMSILPWRSRCNRPLSDAHRTKPPEDGIAIDAIPITDAAQTSSHATSS
jgi:hypothetical protein